MKVHMSEVNINYFDKWYMYFFYTNDVCAGIMILFNYFGLSQSESPIRLQLIVDVDHPQSHIHYTVPNNICQSSAFGKLSSLSINTHTTDIPLSHQLPSDWAFYLKA